MARLKDRYNERDPRGAREQVRLHHADAGSALQKVTLNMGVGEAKQDSKMLEAAQEQLATIAGQKPEHPPRPQVVAAFKLREGMPVGLTVTLRGERAYEFLDRLIVDRAAAHARLPGPEPALVRRARQLLMGIREQVIFPEIDYDTHRPGARARHDDHDHRPDRRRGVRAARGARACPSLATAARPASRASPPNPSPHNQETHGQRHQRSCARRARRSTRRGAHSPLPPLRPAARGVPQVRRSAASACASSRTRATSPA